MRNALRGDAEGIGTIIDNDTAPSVSVNDITVFEGDTGTINATFTVSLSNLTFQPVTVAFATADGTATAGSDYVAQSGTVTVNPGESSKTFTVLVNGDTVNEELEDFFVNLSGPVNATTVKAQGRGRILNDDPKVRFDNANMTVTEGVDRSVVATLTRTGDLTTSTTVNYETFGISASPRSDFTVAIGILTFAPNESAKSINVLITDDAFAESPETFRIQLSGVTGGGIGAPSAVFVTIQSNDTANGPSPVRSQSFNTEFFVRQHYADFLNREPDAGGLAFWSNGIDLCGTDANCLFNKRRDTSAAFFLSIEFQETGFLVYRIYKAAYGEANGIASIGGVPTVIKVPVVRLNEFLPDTQRIGRDVIVGTAGWPERLEANKASFALEFVSRQRFISAFPVTLTPEQFVNMLDTNAGGVLSADERANLIGELTANNTALGRASALRKVAEDADMAAIETNKAFVLMQYFGYLRRNPNDTPDSNHSGYNFWLTKLNQFNGDFRAAQMVEAFIDSIEYKQRFGQP